MRTVKGSNSADAIEKGDFIAMETRGEEVIMYYDTDSDVGELAQRLDAAGLADAKLFRGSADGCSKKNKKECDSAGGCCKWITSGSFNYCKCV